MNTCVSCHGAKLLQLLHKTFQPFAPLMGDRSLYPGEQSSCESLELSSFMLFEKKFFSGKLFDTF